MRHFILLGAAVVFAGCAQELTPSELDHSVLTGASVAGAGYTTFDQSNNICTPKNKKDADCEDSPNGINCNNYLCKQGVYVNGGPTGGGGLTDGDYYFAVIVPGSQNGGFVDGAQGNLSDQTQWGSGKCAEKPELGGDLYTNRTFHVSGGLITSYTGTHATGTSLNGKKIISLYPFGTTCNNGGVYIMAVCQVGATSTNQCKFDAFKAATNLDLPFCQVGGEKYYDANGNGQLDAGEGGIAGWAINFTDSALIADTVSTGANGTFSLDLVAGAYTFAERQSSGWVQTGNLVNQATVTGGAAASLFADKSYHIGAVDGGTIGGLNFGNICLGNCGGRTMGYWSNPNGQAEFGADDLAMVNARHCADDNGAIGAFANYAEFNTWLLNARAVNMAFMLSAQCTATALNVLNGKSSAGAYTYAPGSAGANANGFTTISSLIAEADAAVAADAYTPDGDANRAYQTALKNACDAANQDFGTSCIQAPSSCPAIAF